MEKVAFLKLKNSSLQDYDEICIEDIHNIIPVVDKEGKAHLLINFYDLEYCIDASTFCDEIEEVIIEEYEDKSK
jgi:ribonucleotide reductase alpha subunit